MKMSNRIYINNMSLPNFCDECLFLNDNGDYPMCIITHHSRGYNFPIRDVRMPDCPLREEEIVDDEYNPNLKLFRCKCGNKYYVESEPKWDNDFGYDYWTAKCPECGRENEVNNCYWR